VAIFESLANSLKILAVGDRVKVTLRPETGRFPNPTEGKITQKDDAGNFSLRTEQGVVQIAARDILSVTRLNS
jgi:hypothetical protein